MLATAQPMRPQALCAAHTESWLLRPRRGGRLGVRAAAAAANGTAAAGQAGGALTLSEGAHVVGAVVWSGPKGAKVLLPDDTVGFMPAREAPYAIRDVEERAPAASREVRGLPPLCSCDSGGLLAPLLLTALSAVFHRSQKPCMPKGIVRTFKVISVPPKAGGKAPSGPLLSARQCDLDVLWERAEQLRDVSVQVCFFCSPPCC